MTDLFLPGPFRSHSGVELPFKIDCDALSDGDLATLAQVVGTRPWTRFNDVYGIPRGGLRFAEALKPYALSVPKKQDRRVLIIDDVLTTGNSMLQMREMLRADGLPTEYIGVVIFARGPCPDWVRPIFRHDPWFGP